MITSGHVIMFSIVFASSLSLEESIFQWKNSNTKNTQHYMINRFKIQTHTTKIFVDKNIKKTHNNDHDILDEIYQKMTTITTSSCDTHTTPHNQET